MGVALAKQLASGAKSPLAVGAEPGTFHMVVRLAMVALDVRRRDLRGRTVIARASIPGPGVGPWE